MAGWSFRSTTRRLPRPAARLVTVLVWLVVAVLALGLAAGRAEPRRAHAQGGVPMAQQSALAAASGGGRAALLAEARRELAAMRDTQYQHETEVNAAKGEFYYDCSGFLDYALKRAAPAAFRALPVTASSGRPLAQDFEHHLRQAGGGDPWRSVSTVSALLPGDVIAWLATPDSKTRDTGHVMIVLGAPVHNPQRADEWLVKVVDSTVSPHAQDSRGADDEGLGTGAVGLVADASGHPVGFYWRGGLSKVAKRTDVALGRLG
ncbi:hypothetical protein ACTXG6_40910 [Pseudonocardia sp. Cha107L01]|uniref:hypothetical protein n=1 Tax=Pseudonocardia sp. Cha107L01 TaxID=3457576 RepID=UPI00403ED4DE